MITVSEAWLAVNHVMHVLRIPVAPEMIEFKSCLGPLNIELFFFLNYFGKYLFSIAIKNAIIYNNKKEQKPHHLNFS